MPNGSKLRPAIIAIVVTVTAAGLVVYLLSPAGPVATILAWDATFLITPLLGGMVLVLLSRLVRLFVRPSLSPALAYLGKVLAAVVFGYFLMMGIADLQQSGELYNSFRTLAFYTIVIGCGITVIRLARLFSEIQWDERAKPAGVAAGMLLAGIGIWQGTAAFSGAAPVVANIGLAGFIVLIVMALSNLAAYGQNQRFGALQDVFHWLANAKITLLILGAVLTIYAVFIRPFFDELLISVQPQHIDWIVACLVGLFLLARVSWIIRRDYVRQVAEPQWSRHHQQVTAKVDMDHNYLMRLQRSFVKNGDPLPLLNFLISVLADNQVNEDDIHDILKPMINHLDYRIPWYLFGRLRRGALETVESDRAQVLKKSLEVIESRVLSYRGARPFRQRVHAITDVASIEKTSLQVLQQRFLEDGDRERLVIRLSLILSAAGMREEDIGELLRPLVNYREASRPAYSFERRAVNYNVRQRIMDNLIAATASYSPNLDLRSV